MKTGDVVLIHFPFTDLLGSKVRPAVVVCETPDIYSDVIVCMISSIVPDELNKFEIFLQPSIQNGLRSLSIIRVYRIATVEASKMLASIGKLSQSELSQFSTALKQLISS